MLLTKKEWLVSMLKSELINFDLKKAKEYTKKKSDYIADVFLEAVKRWEMMEGWKK